MSNPKDQPYVIVRDHMAGVHGGFLVECDKATKTATLRGAHKIWYWHGAASCHGIAMRGLSHKGSKVCPTVAQVMLMDVVEIINASQEGQASVTEAPEWRP